MKTLPLAGVVAGALAVSEVFQHALGSNTAACRDTGLSLWCPNLPWQSSEAVGPALQRLPTGVWLLGLGHLGQQAPGASVAFHTASPTTWRCTSSTSTQSSKPTTPPGCSPFQPTSASAKPASSHPG